jgi:hypothetical protein
VIGDKMASTFPGLVYAIPTPEKAAPCDMKPARRLRTNSQMPRGENSRKKYHARKA